MYRKFSISPISDTSLSTGVCFSLFSLLSLYASVFPHRSWASRVYSSISFLSNTKKSMSVSSLSIILRVSEISLSSLSLLNSSSFFCSLSTAFLSKSGLSIISLISFKGNSSSLKNNMLCSLSRAVSSYSLYPASVMSDGFRSPISS